ncbi:unnamed protein product, partial [Closterium sp. Naga37s-1]
MTPNRDSLQSFPLQILPDSTRVLLVPRDLTKADIGLKAARRIEAGEVILVVPQMFFIVANWIALNESERHLQPYDMALPDWDSFTVLAAWLLRERAKGAASPWARYLRSLPAYVPLPALFPQDLIDQFEPRVSRQHMPTCTISAAATLLPSPMPLPSLLFPTPTLLPPPPFEIPLPQATRLKTAYADLYDRCKSSNPAAIANASRSEFYWALSIVTSRSFTFSPSLRARGDGEEQQAEGTDGAERGEDGGLDGADGADGAEVAAEVKEGVATEGAGGEAEEGRSGSSSSSSSSGGGSDGGGSREEDWYATSAAMLPFADLFNHDFYSNVGWKLSGDHFLFTTYQAIEKGEPLRISYGEYRTVDMVAQYGFVPVYNHFHTVLLFPT